MRASTQALRVWAVLTVACVGVLLHAALAQGPAAERQARARAVVRALDLTDAAWFTEARYARHLSQSDLHSAFQDGPASLEHFPSGSLVSPPRHFPTAGFADAEPPRR